MSLLPSLNLSPSLLKDPRLLLDFKTRVKVDLEILLRRRGRRLRLDLNFDLLLVNLLRMALGLVLPRLGHLSQISPVISNHLVLPPLGHQSGLSVPLIFDFRVLLSLQVLEMSRLQLLASHHCRGLRLLNLLDLSFLRLLPLEQPPVRVAQR